MPIPTTAEEARDLLGAAIRDRDHYVFASDSAGGRQLLARFVTGAVAMFDLADAAVLYTDFTLLVTSVGLSREIVVLAVHKEAVPRWAVAAFAALFRGPVPLPPDADVFPVADPTSDPAFLAGVLDMLRRGDCFPVVPGAN